MGELTAQISQTSWLVHAILKYTTPAEMELALSNSESAMDIVTAEMGVMSLAGAAVTRPPCTSAAMEHVS